MAGPTRRRTKFGHKPYIRPAFLLTIMAEFTPNRVLCMTGTIPKVTAFEKRFRRQFGKLPKRMGRNAARRINDIFWWKVAGPSCLNPS